MNTIQIINVLNEGTDSPDVARTYHQSLLPLAERHICESESLLKELLEGVGESLQDKDNPIAELGGEHHLLTTAHSIYGEMLDVRKAVVEFVNVWQGPKVEHYKDDVIDALPTKEEMKNSTYKNSPPHKDLTFYGGHCGNSSYLFFQDKDSGEIFRVPNYKHNRPNQRKLMTWEY